MTTRVIWLGLSSRHRTQPTPRPARLRTPAFPRRASKSRRRGLAARCTARDIHDARLSGPGEAALAAIAGRVNALNNEIGEADRRLRSIVARTAPILSRTFGVGPDVAGHLPATAGDYPNDNAAKPQSPTSAAPHRYRPVADAPITIASTAVVTKPRTTARTPSRSAAPAVTPATATTSTGSPDKASARRHHPQSPLRASATCPGRAAAGSAARARGVRPGGAAGRPSSGASAAAVPAGSPRRAPARPRRRAGPRPRRSG